MKNFFRKEHLLACSGLMLLFGGCSDPMGLQESELEDASVTAAYETVKPRRRGALDDEIASMRFLLVAGTTLPADLEAQVAAAGGSIVQLMPEIGTAVVRAESDDFSVKAAGIAGIRSVLPDFQYQWIPAGKMLEDYHVSNPPTSTDDDYFFNLQWGHDAIDAPEAWAAGYKGAGAVVAVLDAGFDTDHPDLAANVLIGPSRSFVPDEDLVFDPARAGDDFSHGTHVAGTIAAADNGMGIIGVAPDAKVMLLKVLRDSGSGSMAWVAQAIVYAADNGADVINMSLGVAIPRNGIFVMEDTTIKYPSNLINEFVLPIQRAVSYANKKGVTVIASAGNDGSNGQQDGSMLHLPSDLPNVLSISATGPVGWGANPSTDLDVLASYSNYGNKVDFAAPGGNYDLYYQIGIDPCDGPVVPGLPCTFYDWVFSLTNDGWDWSVGTSMASPHASGVAALVVSKYNGNISPAQLTAILKKSANDIYKSGRDPLSGHGRVNAFRAVMQ